ncbi:MAG: hypothetical protein RL628_1122 [Actinomycetota bacterium]
MKSRKAIALVLLSMATLLSCSSDESTSTTTTQVEVGTPTPPIPSEVNAIPFTVGAVAAAGNAEIRMSLPSETPEAAEGFFFLEVQVTSGALEPFTLRPDMFRVYTVDGRSYTPVAAGTIEQFGNATLQTRESYQGILAVSIPTDSEPALFLANLADLGERFFPVAFSVDPNFTPAAPEG